MDQVTFADVLQKSFIAMSMGGADRLTTLNIILNTSMSFLVGMFIFFIYKTTFQGVLYQRSFNIVGAGATGRRAADSGIFPSLADQFLPSDWSTIPAQ